MGLIDTLTSSFTCRLRCCCTATDSVIQSIMIHNCCCSCMSLLTSSQFPLGVTSSALLAREAEGVLKGGLNQSEHVGYEWCFHCLIVLILHLPRTVASQDSPPHTACLLPGHQFIEVVPTTPRSFFRLHAINGIDPVFWPCLRLRTSVAVTVLFCHIKNSLFMWTCCLGLIHLLVIFFASLRHSRMLMPYFVALSYVDNRFDISEKMLPATVL